MPQKRFNIEGGIYFVTSRTHSNKKIFNGYACRLFLEVLDYCHTKLKFGLYAFAIVINHIHLLISPSERNNISDVVRHIKGRFANQYKRLIAEDKFLSCRDGDKNKYLAGEEFILANPADEEFILPRTAGEEFILANPADEEFILPRTAGEEFILANPADEEFILAKNEPIWQKSFYDRIIRCDKQLQNTINYIDGNAVKHGLVDDPIKWLFSSYHNHYETGKELIKIDYLDE